MIEKKIYYGWVIVIALWLIYFLNMGFPLYGGIIINSYMLKEIAMSRSTYGLSYTFLNLCIGVFAVLIGWTITKWGLKITFVISTIILLIGTILTNFITQPWHFVVVFGVIIGTGIGFGTIMPIQTGIVSWFKVYRGRAMGIVLTAAGVGGFIGAPLVQKIMAANDGNWRAGWNIISILIVVSGAIAVILIKNHPSDVDQMMDGISDDKELANTGRSKLNAKLITSYEWTYSEVVKTKEFWLIVFSGNANLFPFFFFTAHWILHVKDLGISPAAAALCMGIFSGVSIFGRLFAGVLLDKYSANYVWIGGLLFYIAAIITTFSITSPPMAYLAAGLFGYAFGHTFNCQATIMGNYFGVKAYAKSMGLFTMITSTICSSAGIIGGKIFDITNSYNGAFYIILVITSISIVALYFTKIPVKDQSA